MSFRALVEKSPAIAVKTIVHDQPKTLARRGSLPSVAGATVSASARFSRYGYAYAQNDNLSGRARRLIRISIIKTKRTPVPPCHCERSVAISRKGNVGNAPAPAKCPRWLTAAPRRLAATIRIIQYFF